MTALIEWFDGKPLGAQLLVLAAVLDPLGLLGGYLLLPDLLGVSPTAGAGYGLVAASLPLGTWAVFHAEGGDAGGGNGNDDAGSE